MAKRGSKRGPVRRRAYASAGFVLDCSVALSWFFLDEANDYADRVAMSLATDSAIVPAVWPLEAANALLVGERRRRCTEAQSAVFLARVAELRIVMETTSARHWNAVLAVARQHALSAYDAAYLELAMRRSLPLASLDNKLLAAAASAGVARFVADT